METVQIRVRSIGHACAIRLLFWGTVATAVSTLVFYLKHQSQFSRLGIATASLIGAGVVLCSYQGRAVAVDRRWLLTEAEIKTWSHVYQELHSTRAMRRYRGFFQNHNKIIAALVLNPTRIQALVSVGVTHPEHLPNKSMAEYHVILLRELHDTVAALWRIGLKDASVMHELRTRSSWAITGLCVENELELGLRERLREKAGISKVVGYDPNSQNPAEVLTKFAERFDADSPDPELERLGALQNDPYNLSPAYQECAARRLVALRDWLTNECLGLSSTDGPITQQNIIDYLALLK